MQETGGSRQLLWEGHFDLETYKTKQESNLVHNVYMKLLKQQAIVASVQLGSLPCMYSYQGVCPQDNFEK